MKCNQCQRDISTDDAVIHEGSILCNRCLLDLIITRLIRVDKELQGIKDRLDYFISLTKSKGY
jgi:LIM domain.